MEQDQLDELMQRLEDLISSGGVTRRCVSLAQGDLAPDLRVNYEFGLVLGVDEFRQEQLYFLHKDYLHNRALHGYGTVAGLQVVPEPAGAGDVKLTVTPGIGIDQCGRTFVVRNPQCAFLNAWFQRQQQQESPNLQPGAKRLYVVATYDECPDALVAIAGQPCSSSQQSQAPSRIRDSFQIALRWEPPAMPTWDAIQCFAELMADVQITPDLPASQSDKAEIIELVRLLDDCEALRERRRPSASYPEPYGYGYDGAELTDAPRYLYLPAATAHQDLDDIFRVWVTEVRPRLQPDVIECGFGAEPGETGVLLAALNVQLAFTEAGAPIVTLLGETDLVDNTGRPYLLATQVIQELMARGGIGGAGSAQEFATLSIRDERTLLLWVHHPEMLNLSGDINDTLELFSNDDPLSGSILPVPGFSNVFGIRVDQELPPAARITLRFRLDAIRVSGDPLADDGQPGRAALLERLTPAARAALRSLAEARAISGSTALLASIDLFGAGYIGREGETITIYTVAPAPAETPELPTPPEQREFVTISTRTIGVPRPALRLWIHADEQLTIPNNAVRATVIRGSNSTNVAFNLTAVNGALNQWELRPSQVILRNGDQVLLTFASDQLQLPNGQSLTEAMRQGNYRYVDDDGAGQISAFYSVEIAPEADGISAEEVNEIVRRVRTLPLVTITPTSWNRTNVAQFELWFHPHQQADQGDSRMGEPNFRVYMEVIQTGQVVPVSITDLSRLGPYHFNALVDFSDLFEFGQRLPTYARFVFPIDNGNSIETREGTFASLREYMDRLNIKFDGYFVREEVSGEEVLVIYVRFEPFLLGQRG
jgi:hypothetical protein